MTINAQPGTLLQFDFCVKDSQRLADLTGIQADLESSFRYCDLHIEIDPTQQGISIDEMSRREHTRQALCRAALVMYGRAWGWGSGVRSGLGAEYVTHLSMDARNLHEIVKSLRDKWVAHAVNHFDDVRVHINVTVNADGSLVTQGVSTLSHSIGGFVQAWMIQFRSLVSEVLFQVKREIAKESERLSSIVRNMHIDDVLRRKRVDGVALGQTVLQPKRVRKNFPDH